MLDQYFSIHPRKTINWVSKLFAVSALAAILTACGLFDEQQDNAGEAKNPGQTPPSKVIDSSSKGISAPVFSKATDGSIEVGGVTDNGVGQEATPGQPPSGDDVAAQNAQSGAEGARLEEAIEAEPDKVVFRQKSEGYLEWLAPTELAYNQAEVTITRPDGVQESYSFDNGEPMVLHGNLEDGLYRWESVIVPDIEESVKAELMEIRERGNLAEITAAQENYRSQGYLPTELQTKDNRLSGAFRVQNSAITATRTDHNKDDK